MLLSKHRYPEYDFSRSLKEIDKFKRNIWLELNGFMTPLEQVNVLCNMLFNYYKLKGNEVNYAKSDEFLLTHVIETKNGNAVSNTMLILVLSELFDINIKLIGIPRQFILGCFDAHEQILFYLDGATGIMYSEAEVHTYFKRVGLSPTPSYFKAKDNTAVISAFLSEYKKCFNSENQSGTLSELEELLEMLNRE
jgi:regulator of sirC expression with transglutaminase-like and TPR domain